MADPEQKDPTKSAASPARRRMLSALAVATGAAAADTVLPERWTKPVVNSIVLPAHAQATTCVTPIQINGTLGSAATTGVQNARLNRNGVASTCAAPKACDIFLMDTLEYDAYSWTNACGTDICVAVTFTVTETTSSNYQCNAYSGSFDPNNICTNYLADPGLSSGIPPAATTFSFQVAAGATFVLQVHTITAGSFGGTYTIDISLGPDAPPSGGTPHESQHD